jgi:hypothetical protein
MKSKKSLSLIVILSFLFVTNFVMFIIVQRPLYAEGCGEHLSEECDPTGWCASHVWSFCESFCEAAQSECKRIEVEDAYCAEGPWYPCECISVWDVTCENDFSMYTYCNEENPSQCPYEQK